MNRFADILREADQRLDLPRAARARIVLEMAADLEDIFDYHHRVGLPEEEAEERARESFALSDEALADLVRVHASGYRRFLDQLGEQGRQMWERVAFGLLLLFAVAVSGGHVLARGAVRDAGPVGWVVVGLTAVAFAIAVRGFYALYLGEGRDLRRLRALVPTILVLGGIELLVGLYSCWFKVHGWLLGYAAAGESDVKLLIETLRAGAALSVVTLACTVLSALMWYVLHTRLECLEHDAALALLDN